MATSDLAMTFPTLSQTSQAIFQTHNQIFRWSNTHISPNSCAAIVIPSTEQDINAVIKFASQNRLKVLPTAGKHGSSLPINERSIYLDLKNFDQIELDEQNGSVTIGGGVLAGRLCDVLAERGWYCSHPNSNAVGMVGYVLGGGNSVINGIHSLAVDSLLSVRIITSSGGCHTVSPNSQGDEKDLYNVLCGAGFGFGVITSITLQAWRISALNLDNDKVWTRRLIFSPSAISTAAALFSKLSTPPPSMSTTLLFLRAPPSAPNPGSPVLMLVITYLGPAAAAEEASKTTFAPSILSEAVTATTAATSFALLNASTDPLNRHGDFKTNYATWSHSISAEQIQLAFDRWLQLGYHVPDAEASSFFLVNAKNPACMLGQDLEGEKSFPRTIRGRSIFAQAYPWWTKKESEEDCRKWGRDMLEILGERGAGGEEKGVNGFAANLNEDIELEEVWPLEKIEEIRRVKGIWDRGSVFWNPVVDGW